MIMRNPLRTLAPFLAILAAVPVVAQSAHSDPASHGAHHQEEGPEEAAVREAVSYYLRAHATGDGSHLDNVFHPTAAALYWVTPEGELQTRPGSEYQAGFRGTPPADEAERERWIEMVDVTGDAAVAKVVLDYPSARFTDYFALLKVDGEWRVITKIFHRAGPSGG